jgi:predicted MPP superfamily phosphohydrolase
MRIVIFIVVFLSLHLLLNSYIGYRAWQALELYPAVRPWFLVAFVVLAFSYVLGEMLERKAPSIISDVLVWVGAFWFAYMVYFLFAIVLIDLVRLVQHFAHFLPSPTPGDYLRFKFFGGLSLTVFLTIVMLRGFYNATHIRLNRVEIAVDKPAAKESIKIVLMSDLHLGTIISRGRLRKMVDAANALNPDIILLAGDVVDGSPKPAMAAKLGELFKSLRSTYGTYAITGNHEYIGDADASVRYFSEHHVNWLRDASAEVAGMVIVGREDLSMRNADGTKRKSMQDLMVGIDQSKPIIVMDHQPFKLEESEQAGADLQVSGHTHHAQMWPLNYITKKVYELSWGYKTRGKTHYYVSCGIGTWGPPVTIGSYSEIVEIVMKFGKADVSL